MLTVFPLAIAGKGAPEPITGQQNASSTCWPITAKNNDLTLVDDYGYRVRISHPWGRTHDFNYSMKGTEYVRDIGRAMFAITPILTLFYPGQEGSLVNTSDASLSCIKVMGPALATLKTMYNGEGSNGASGLSASNPYFLILAMLFLFMQS